MGAGVVVAAAATAGMAASWADAHVPVTLVDGRRRRDPVLARGQDCQSGRHPDRPTAAAALTFSARRVARELEAGRPGPGSGPCTPFAVSHSNARE
jgi:hypothetical protein